MNYYQIDFNTAVGVNITFMFVPANKAIWDSNTTISGYVDTIKTEKLAWDADAQIQETDTTGATDVQTAKRIDAALQTVHIVKGLKAFYMSIDDLANYKIINYPISKLVRGSKKDAITKMKIVHDNAAGITPVSLLANFYITATNITKQADAITAFATSQDTKQNAKNVSKTATSKIKIHESTIRKTYKKLDPLIAAMALTNPDFASGYLQSKEIYKMGKGHQTADLTIDIGKNVTAFGNKFEAGYYFLIRNKSKFPILVGLSTTENGAIQTTPIQMAGKTELVVFIPKSAIDMLTRYLCIQNVSKTDKAKVTVIMSKEKSMSKAAQVEINGIPK